MNIKKVVGTSVLSLGLVVGLAGFAGASSGMIDTTGPNSNNEVNHDWEYDLEVDNENDVDLDNNVDQDGHSGDAEVKSNTTGGDAESGSVSNDSSVDAMIEIDNSSSGAWAGAVGGSGDNEGSVENTGPYSDNYVNFESDVDVEIDNDNDVNIDNDVDQYASSGDAEVKYNTTGGSATSGSVSNTSSSSFTVRITN